ncbi:MAG TPA: hypothetical protein VGD74_12170 [Vulgatibacter sp.]
MERHREETIRRPRRRATDPKPADLTETFERLATRIGDDIGRELVRALGPPPARRRPPKAKAICSTEGCERFVAAKGLCKSHYNLMLYHRRKRLAPSPPGAAAAKKRGGRGG